MGWKKTLCNLCAMTCGLEMEIEDNRIVSVRPDPDSPNSDCYCCRKGRTAKYFVENSERILYPKKRVGDHYERISWEQAYAEIAEKARAILDLHGPALPHSWAAAAAQQARPRLWCWRS